MFSLPLGLHVKETEDNEAVVSTLIDIHRLITCKHLPAVQGWVQVSTNKVSFVNMYCSTLQQ